MGEQAGTGPRGCTRRAAVAASVLVGLLAVGCGSSGSKSVATTQPAAPGGVFGEVEKTYQGSGPRVAVLGDSIMVATKAQLRALLTRESLKVAALTGEGLSGGSLSHVLGGGTMPEIAADMAGDHPEVVVIELGTNDAWHTQLTAAAARRALRSIVASFDGSCFVAVAISETSTATGYDRSEARQINRDLRAHADQVVDWGALSGADPERYLKSDGVHPTAAGAEMLARSITAAVHACGA